MKKYAIRLRYGLSGLPVTEPTFSVWYSRYNGRPTVIGKLVRKYGSRTECKRVIRKINSEYPNAEIVPIV